VPYIDISDGGALSAREFARICDLIHTQTGIHLSPEKKTMVEVRLKRRLRTLNMKSYHEYCELVFSRGGINDELVNLIDVITTNKTDFFREPTHFAFLAQRALPEADSRSTSTRPFRVWSAGCSTGEEPYTLAMVLSEYALIHPGFRFRILATDISTAVLEKASLGIYSTEAIGPVPVPLRRKYLLRSRNPESPRVRIKPGLRSTIEFKRLNFMDADYAIHEKADAIFCRNVLIYFDRETQRAIVNKLITHLVTSGYLFVGHSETLHDMNLAVSPVAAAVYRKVNGRA
jgi:chemotaxis protein methyltransferase CheR